MSRPNASLPRQPGVNVQRASELMGVFAERTGVRSDRPQQRYLWTDAFAVCNFVGLRYATGEEQYTNLALRLVDCVHLTLGRHRADDARLGWLSGLSEGEGKLHPTRGGLRIGKKLPERPAGEPLHERLEWERDGQYFHYLTKWMHALDQASRSTVQPHLNCWALELAQVAHDRFVLRPAHGQRRMMWKMSIDFAHRSDLHSLLDALEPYAALGPALVSFWLEPEHRRVRTWLEHFDLNEVMLASALVPDGVLTLRAPAAG